MFDPIILDIEASGFGSGSYPIEVGVALPEGKGFCRLISPAPGWTHWKTEAEKTHKISREMLAVHGRPVHEVAKELNWILEGLTVYSDGWVVDKPWLTTLFHAASLPMKFKVSPLEMILSEEQMKVWYETKEQVTRQTKLQRHRARCDASIIQETFNLTWLQTQRDKPVS